MDINKTWKSTHVSISSVIESIIYVKTLHFTILWTTARIIAHIAEMTVL